MSSSRPRSLPTDHPPTTREQPPVTITLATTDARRPRPGSPDRPPRPPACWPSWASPWSSAGPAGASTDTGTPPSPAPGPRPSCRRAARPRSSPWRCRPRPPATATPPPTATTSTATCSRRGRRCRRVTFTRASRRRASGSSTSGTYYGPVNTAIGTGQITEIPNDFEWAPMIVNGYLPLTGRPGCSTRAPAPRRRVSGRPGSSAPTRRRPGRQLEHRGHLLGQLLGPERVHVVGHAGRIDHDHDDHDHHHGADLHHDVDDRAGLHHDVDHRAGIGRRHDDDDHRVPWSAAATTSDDGGSHRDRRRLPRPPDPSGTSGSTDGTLAFTGLRTARDIGIGLLAVGLGVMLLSWGHRRRVRAGRGTGR